MTARVRRRYLWVPLVALLSLIGCASLLDVDGYESSPETLCDLLDRCFDGEDLSACRSEVDAALDGATPEVRAKWLASFLDLSCAKQCTGARRCLDLDPLCLGANATCDRTEDCCGFLTGQAECQALTVTPTGQDPVQQCCRPLGVACDAGAPCCAGLECDTLTGTCGGVQCKFIDELCSDNAECCTKVCNRGSNGDGKCGPLCGPSGFSCGADTPCCEGLLCDSGTCRVPVCVPNGAPCDPQSSTKPCCEGQCQPLDATGSTTGGGEKIVGVCVKDGCFPRDSACDPAGSVPCCAGSNCVKGVNRCGTNCVGKDGYCVRESDCCGGLVPEDGPGSALKSLRCDITTNSCATCSKGYCETNEDCCSQKCNPAGFCETACAATPEPACTHSMTQSGGLLAVETSPGVFQHCNNVSQHYIEQKCVETICSVDKSCCCSGWDELCATAALVACPPQCAPFQPKCSHGMDVPGTILGTATSANSYKSCDASGTGYVVKPGCVDKICQISPHCCCSKWTQACVSLYTSLKSAGDPSCK
jgi:hypothetical protein